MKKAFAVLTTIAIVVLLTGCTITSNSVPGERIPLGLMSTSDTYSVVGPIEGTSSGGYIMGFIPVGHENKSGSISGGIPYGQMNPQILISPIARAALYNAIESNPEADAMFAPRWEYACKNYVVYREVTITVKGKGIKFGM